jgi:hypothetical protein
LIISLVVAKADVPNNYQSLKSKLAKVVGRRFLMPQAKSYESPVFYKQKLPSQKTKILFKNIF